MVLIIDKLVYTPTYHLWSDALHLRALANEAKNEWDRGTYVRSAINSAWTAFELYCKDVLDVEEIQGPFQDNLNKLLQDNHNKLLVSKSFQPLEWGKGFWQKVAGVYKMRKDYTHINSPKSIVRGDLTPDSKKADEAIEILREGIKRIYSYVRESKDKDYPRWVEFDRDPGWRGVRSFANLQTGNDVPGAIELRYFYEGKEYTHGFFPDDTDLEALVDNLVYGTKLHISVVRAYQDKELKTEWRLFMRGTN